MILVPYGQAWTIRGWQLVDRATGQYKVSPTLAAGDVKIEKDGGASENIATLPAVAPAAGSSLDIAFSAAELQCKQAAIRFVDAAGAEWNDDCVHVFTVGHPNAYMQFDLFSASVALSAGSLSQVTGGVWNELRANHNLPGSFGERGLSAADIAAMFDEVIGTLAFRNILIAVLAASAGVCSGAQPGATTMRFRNADDSADVLEVPTDEYGNRLSVTYHF